MQMNFSRWRANFWTGLAIVLPAVASIAIVVWVFGGVTNLTDKPLVAVLKVVFPDPGPGPSGIEPPNEMIYANKDETKIHWYWRFLGLLITVVAIGMVGAFARFYIGKKIIATFHETMLRIPLLNRIYGAVKQVNDAFTTNNKSSFKQVVMVEFPSPGLHSIGFITGENHPEVQSRLKGKIVSVFVPTTPNPTTGFLILVDERHVVKLRMPVSDGIKYIMSLGSVAPALLPTPSLPVAIPAPPEEPTPPTDPTPQQVVAKP